MSMSRQRIQNSLQKICQQPSFSQPKVKAALPHLQMGQKFYFKYNWQGSNLPEVNKHRVTGWMGDLCCLEFHDGRRADHERNELRQINSNIHPSLRQRQKVLLSNT